MTKVFNFLKKHFFFYLKAQNCVHLNVNQIHTTFTYLAQIIQQKIFMKYKKKIKILQKSILITQR
jgi:hypothetical protein